MAHYKGYKGDTTRVYRKLYGYKNLLAWQAADELAAFVHDIVVRFKPRYFNMLPVTPMSPSHCLMNSWKLVGTHRSSHELP